MRTDKTRKVTVKIFRGKRWNGTVEGQLLVIDGTPCIIPVDNHLPSLPFDDCLTFDGHHITQEVDSPLWVDAESVEFVREEEIELTF